MYRKIISEQKFLWEQIEAEYQKWIKSDSTNKAGDENFRFQISI